MSLHSCQEHFAKALSMSNFADAAAWVQGNGLEAQRRLWLYHNQIHDVWREALEITYPAVLLLTGQRYFRLVARGYAESYDSSSGNLKDYGEYFPAYLEGRLEIHLYPYIPDVARLEWARTQSMVAREEPAIPLAALANIEAALWANVRCRIAPSLHLVASPYPIDRIWAAAPDGTEPKVMAREGLLRREAAAVAIYRCGHAVTVETLQPPVWRWLLALQDGRCLHEAVMLACEVEARVGMTFDLPGSLQWAFDRGLITGVEIAA